MPRFDTTAGGFAKANFDKRRTENLVTLVNHCNAAKAIADGQGDKFLSYMLAMTIEAAEGQARVNASARLK